MTISCRSYTFDGKVKTPSVVVKDSDGRVIGPSNYKVTYSSDRKSVGTYTVKVTMKGNYYAGTKTATFTIVPRGTSLRSVSAAKKAFTAKWNAQKTKMTKYTVTGYQLQYSTDSRFAKATKITTVKGYKSTSKKISKLAAKKKYYVRIRTYTKVSGKTYYSAWSKAKVVTTKKQTSNNVPRKWWCRSNCLMAVTADTSFFAFLLIFSKTHNFTGVKRFEVC